MTTRQKILNNALACVGKHRSEVECAGTHDWCAQFVSRVLNWSGINIYNTFVGPLRTDLLQSDLFYEPDDPPIGADIISIDWDHVIEARPLDHIVICVDYDPNTRMITYVNGNGDSSTHVTKQQISIDSPHVMFWTRLKENSDSESEETKTTESGEFEMTLRTLKYGDAGKNVTAMQQLLEANGFSVGPCGCDGEIGPATIRALEDYQDSKHLQPDGICGPLTWSALLE